MPLALIEQLAYSTVRLECTYADGNTGTGTGHLMKLKDTGTEHIPVIITNKHVVQNASGAKFTFCKTDEKGDPMDKDHVTVNYQNLQSHIKYHPDTTVDLCAIPLGPIIHQAEQQKMQIFRASAKTDLIPSNETLKEFAQLEEIVMIGYPVGIWDQHNNKPIFRRGHTATHPAHDYNGRKEFLIDMACFPGSSGSPVFLYNPPGYADKRGNVNLGRSRLFLLGTLYAGPQYTSTGEIKVIDVPTHAKPIAQLEIPINLGLVIRSERILEIEALF